MMVMVIIMIHYYTMTKVKAQLGYIYKKKKSILLFPVPDDKQRGREGVGVRRRGP